jgi:hypothetical protein
MNHSGVLSDQLFTWSDNYVETIILHFTKTPPGFPPQTTSSHSHSPGLSYRALQTLWQAGLQVCQGPRSWPQVLPVDKLSASAPANGLCAAGISRPDQDVSRQLPTCSRPLRGDLRDQPRTVAPPRGALRSHDERYVFLAHHANRFGIGRHPPRQYARDLARRSTKFPDNRGGDR